MDRQFGALSGLAILLIVLNHSINSGINFPLELGYPAINEGLRIFLSVIQGIGVFGVPIFFFISGSFVAFSAKGEPPTLSKKFLLSSIRHILWPYLIWSIISYILVYLLHSMSYSPIQYIKNLMVGFPYHFVPLLIFYYVISPLLVRLIYRFKGVVIVVIAIYQLFLLSYLYPGSLGITYLDWARFFVPPVIRTTFASWGVFFPLGLYYGKNSAILKPIFNRLKWLFIMTTVGLYGAAYLGAFTEMEVPLARFLVPIPFIFLIPLIKRKSIPYVRQLERVGRKSYGIYLMNLIVIDLVLLSVQVLIPGLLNYSVVLITLIFILGVLFPLLLMETVAKSPAKRVYRYVFG